MNEQALYFIVFLCLISAMMIWINPFKTEKSITISFKKGTAEKKRMQINALRSLSRYEKLQVAIDSLLTRTGKGKRYLYMLIGIFFIAGVIAGMIIFSDMTLAVVTGIALTPGSYIFLKAKAQNQIKKELEELENAMSIITNAYMVNDNIVKAVEVYVAEQDRYVDERFRKITPFKEFVSDSICLEPNVQRGLAILGGKIDNTYFQQWIKTLQLCSRDRRLKFALFPIVKAMSDEKSMQIENDTAMRSVWNEYITMVIIMFSLIPLFRISQYTWFEILTQTVIGKLLIIIMIITALVTTFFVMKKNKPINSM